MTNLPKSVPNPLLPAGWLTWKQITLVREEVAVEVADVAKRAETAAVAAAREAEKAAPAS